MNLQKDGGKIFLNYGNALGAGNLGIMIVPATPYHSISIEDSNFRSGVARSIWRSHSHLHTVSAMCAECQACWQFGHNITLKCHIY